jgi:two-component system sensor histidine kinase KdpD
VRAETERLRATVLSSISHDLRGPLTSIVGATSSLEYQWSSLDDATRLTLVRDLRDEAGRLDGYVEKLLDITTLEAGALALKHEPVSVPEILDATLRQAGRVIANHQLDVDIPGDLMLVEADALLLRQVLYNLLENAAKYAPSGSQIRIVARDGDASVRISVLDEGVGIPAPEIDRIFDKFHRAPGADRLATGMGLGLTICRGFVEAMGGQIEAGNRDDRVGAVLAFTLPASAQPAYGSVQP